MGWLSQTFVPDEAGPASLDPTKLTDVLKWASGGFVLLTGVLTFFGVKEGALDRLVRASAIETMAIFLFIGAGVLLALAAPAIHDDDTKRAPLALVTIAAGAMVLLSGVVIGRDLADDRLSGPLTVAAGLLTVLGALAVVIMVRKKVTIRWSVAVAALAVTSVSCGLYNAAKLVVLDKLDTVGASIAANLTETDGRRTLTVKVSGEDVASPLRLQVEGLGPNAHPVLSAHTLTPDRADSVAADISVPVSGSTWTELRVVACQDEARAGAAACRPSDVYARFPLHRDPPVIGASLTLDAKTSTVTYSVDAASLPGSTYLTVSVGHDQTAVINGRRVPTADGTLTWSGTSAVTSKQSWAASVARCDASVTPARCTEPEVLATLVVP